jgi:hypothetical protein
VNDHHVTTGELASLACTHHASGIPGYTCCSAQDDCSLWSQNVLQKRVTDNACADGAQANDRWIDVNSLTDLEQVGEFTVGQP